MASFRAQPESEPQMVRHEASKNCSVFNGPSLLSERVTTWKRSRVENVLHIYYEKQFTEPQEILDKIPTIKKICSKQEELIAILNRPNFIPSLVHYDHITSKKQLTESMQAMKTNFPVLPPEDSTSSSLCRHQRILIYSALCRYYSAIENLVDEICKKRESASRTSVCEDSYAQVVSAFAAMCGLKAVEGNEGNKSVWDHMRGMNSAVIAKPDLRFYCTGDDFSTRNDILTVIKVKSEDWNSDEETLKRKQDDKFRRTAKRRRCSVSNSSSSSSFPSSESDEELFLHTETNAPYIQYDVGMNTLGQHAGDLLLDLHNYMQHHKCENKPSILTMPGMIVDKNLVYLTLLEMSYQHYEKLIRTEKLTSEDRATIYYALPLDIFHGKTIPTLIDTFVKLNIIESIIKYED